MAKTVAIVGAGISGILACKYAASRGFNTIVFEEDSQVGGLWNHTIESTKLQTVKDIFQFSDFPWPDSVKDLYPHNTEVAEYIQSYARHFDLLQYIHFNSRVVSVDFVGVSEEEMGKWELWGGSGKAFGSKGQWDLKVLDLKDHSIKEYVADFLVLCIGRFSGFPFIPEFPPGDGPEVFSGKVIHSVDYSNMDNAAAAEFIKGKKVAIIGSGKSAIDIAFECATINGSDHPTMLIQRTIHWVFTNPVPWGLNLGYLLFNRFSELMIHKPGEGFFLSAMASLLSPLRWALSKFVESYVRWKLPLKQHDMVPKHSFFDESASCKIFMVDENFYEKVNDGSLLLRRADHFRFCKEGVMVEGDLLPLKPDIVIFATGYRGDEKLKNIFASPTFQGHIFGSPKSIIPLYRQMIPPRIPQLAVIGYSESLANLYTFEIRCKWLAFFMDQVFQLPSIKEMEDDIKKWNAYACSSNSHRRSCISGTHIWYNDQLCKDIGCNPRRKKGFFSELFEPYTMHDYNGIYPRQS